MQDKTIYHEVRHTLYLLQSMSALKNYNWVSVYEGMILPDARYSYISDTWANMHYFILPYLTKHKIK